MTTKNPTTKNSALALVITASTIAVTAVGIISWWRKSQQSSSGNQRSLKVEVECACGKVGLFVDDSQYPVHLVCYCDDCQNYAQWMMATMKTKRKNNNKDDNIATETATARPVVDNQGGSRTCQVFRRNVRILKGSNLLVSSYLDPLKVPSGRPQRMYRIHTECCGTPICSAYWDELPLMGIYAANMKIIDDGNKKAHTFVYHDPKDKNWGDDEHTSTAGTIIPSPEYRINCMYAKSENPIEGGHPEFPIKFLIRFLWRNFVVGRRSSSAVVEAKFSIPVGEDKSIMRSI